MSIQIQRLFVPIANAKNSDGSLTPVFMTDEHRRPLQQMADQLAAAQTAITALQARLTAAGIP